MRLMDCRRNPGLTDLNCSEACRSTRMTSNLAERLVSPGQKRKMKTDRLLGKYIHIRPIVVLISSVSTIYTYMQDTQGSC